MIDVKKIRDINRAAWDQEVKRGNTWTIPVAEEVINAARGGSWQIVLTPTKPVPGDWFPAIEGLEVLCLASGGGQQAPVLAAAGANVTVLDNSPRQLAQDRYVAKRDGLQLTTIEGDMADLGMFAEESFDLIVHPVSNCFVPDIHPVWREAYRVLRSGGALLSGFSNPVIYLFDYERAKKDEILQVKYRIPYADIFDLTEEEKQHYEEAGWTFEFSHTLEDQIGGQIIAGFVITGFYEDVHRVEEKDLLSQYISIFCATKAIKSRGVIR